MQTIGGVLGFVLVTAFYAGCIGGVAYFFGFRNPAFAFMVNWVVMTWAATVAGAFQFSFPFPAAYFRIGSWEAKGGLYRMLGVRFFKTLMVRTPLAVLNPTLRVPEGRASLSSLERKMQEAEANHLLVFIIVTAISGYAALNAWWDLVASLMAFNIGLNVYPVMLQRYNRARLAPLFDRMSRRSAAK